MRTVNGTVRYNHQQQNPNTAITGNNVFASPFYAYRKSMSQEGTTWEVLVTHHG